MEAEDEGEIISVMFPTPDARPAFTYERKWGQD